MKTLYYIHDPMCSWCWAFNPTWTKIKDQLDENITVSYIVGGLAPDSSISMDKSLKEHIKGHWKIIQERVPGTKFNFDFWDKCKPRRSTYPACRAVLAAKSQGSKFETLMVSGIQHAYYLNAQNPSDDDTLISVAKNIGLDVNKFTHDLNSAVINKRLKQEITFGSNIGAEGFPSLILEDDGKLTFILIDYNDASVSLSIISSA